MVTIMPDRLSFLVKYPAMMRIRIVTGIAAIVRANSTSLTSTTTTTNWTVNPRKKKKSNLRRAIYIYAHSLVNEAIEIQTVQYT